MTHAPSPALPHNHPANYAVAQLSAAEIGRGVGGTYAGGDFVVRRVCPCCRRAVVSVPFETREQAAGCLAAIERDWERYGSRDAAAGTQA